MADSRGCPAPDDARVSPSDTSTENHPLRVLIVHNRYRSELPSGENGVVDRDLRALRKGGVEVRAHQRSSDELASWSPSRRAGLAVRSMRPGTRDPELDRCLRDFRPTVVHLHNPFPLGPPGVVAQAHAHGVRVVQTVHNYRHVCPSGVYYRDGSVCTDCRGRRVAWPAALHGCYRNSRAQSAVMATAMRVHRRSFSAIDLFIAVSPFTPDSFATTPMSRPTA